MAKVDNRPKEKMQLTIEGSVSLPCARWRVSANRNSPTVLD